MSDTRTDHSEAIKAMRDMASVTRTMLPTIGEDGEHDSLFHEVLILECAAALLEVHDDTGISLDDFLAPRALVEHALLMVNTEYSLEHTLTENGV